jgi:hypothetical protein
VWKREDPRVTILHAYSHLATHWHRLNVPPVVRASDQSCDHFDLCAFSKGLELSWWPLPD